MRKFKPLSDARKRQISESLTGRVVSAATREKIRQSLLGHPVSAVTRKKLRKANTGKPGGMLGKHPTAETTAKHSAAISGLNNPNFGKPRSLATRKKIGKANRGQVRSEEVNQRNRESHTGKRLTEATKQKMRDARGGDKHWNWQGGISRLPYSLDWTRTLRRSIRERDRYTCRLCGAQQEDRAFSVHHIDYEKTHCDPINLITLCPSCHTKTNADRELWTGLFQHVMGAI